MTQNIICPLVLIFASAEQTLIYRKDEDVMTYRWTPNFNNKTAFILSGTLKSEYVEKQINQPVVGIAQNWTISGFISCCNNCFVNSFTRRNSVFSYMLLCIKGICHPSRSLFCSSYFLRRAQVV